MNATIRKGVDYALDHLKQNEVAGALADVVEHVPGPLEAIFVVGSFLVVAAAVAMHRLHNEPPPKIVGPAIALLPQGDVVDGELEETVRAA